MDKSTITFGAVLLVAFLFLRWFISPDLPAESESVRTRSRRVNRLQQQRQRRRVHRAVTDDMIEIVQALAPDLTVGQIKLDLQRTGSVEATVERYLAEGTLPFPEGEVAAPATQPATSSSSSLSTSVANSKNVEDQSSDSVYDKYVGSNVNESVFSQNGLDNQEEGKLNKSVVGWAKTKEQRAKNLQQKKAEMVLRARQRLKTSLDDK